MMTQNANTDSFTLPACLDISGAEPLLEQMRNFYAGCSALHLDASHVERFTAPALQIVLSALLQAEKEGKACSLLSPSACVSKAINDFGLNDTFRKWMH